jgi:mRNA interferase RelE/StbE
VRILVDRSFEHDVKKLPVRVQNQLIEFIQKISAADSFEGLSLSKMGAARNAYRIRLGDYRVGFYLEGDSIILSRILNRKEIYRYFPKK